VRLSVRSSIETSWFVSRPQASHDSVIVPSISFDWIDMKHVIVSVDRT
jgi:hypothetical protein